HPASSASRQWSARRPKSAPRTEAERTTGIGGSDRKNESTGASPNRRGAGRPLSAGLRQGRSTLRPVATEEGARGVPEADVLGRLSAADEAARGRPAVRRGETDDVEPRRERASVDAHAVRPGRAVFVHDEGHAA